MSQQAVNGVPCRGKVLTLDNMNPNVRRVEYAVRGPIVQRAMQLEKELKEVTLNVKCGAAARAHLAARGPGVKFDNAREKKKKSEFIC